MGGAVTIGSGQFFSQCRPQCLASFCSQGNADFRVFAGCGWMSLFHWYEQLKGQDFANSPIDRPGRWEQSIWREDRLESPPYQLLLSGEAWSLRQRDKIQPQ